MFFCIFGEMVRHFLYKYGKSIEFKSRLLRTLVSLSGDVSDCGMGAWSEDFALARLSIIASRAPGGR